ncbi:MAG: citrate/2-methylcitrate synthase, partial [Acidobacteriota bacterium]
MTGTEHHPRGQKAAGLAGIVIAHSSLCFIDGQKGELRYRGYDIHDLARQATFEETAALLWDGELPDQARLDHVKQELSSGRELPEEVLDTFWSFPDSVGPMASLRTGVSMLPAFDGES